MAGGVDPVVDPRLYLQTAYLQPVARLRALDVYGAGHEVRALSELLHLLVDHELVG